MLYFATSRLKWTQFVCAINCASFLGSLFAMIKLNVYLDARRVKAGRPAPLKISITRKCQVRYVSMGLSALPAYWDSAQRRLRSNAPLASHMNVLISRRLLAAEEAVLELRLQAEPSSIDEVRDAVAAVISPKAKPAPAVDPTLVLPAFLRFIETKTGKTRSAYVQSLSRLRAYCPALDSLHFEDVTRSWLIEFDAFLAKTAPSQNSRADYLICLRAVFNFAIDDGLTTWYPFRKFKVRKVRTVKRSLSVGDLRRLFNAEVRPSQLKYLDFFKLSFMLLGMNSVDLLHLPPDAIKDGRIDFSRSKTKSPVSVFVEPEALEIINRNRGRGWLLDPMDRYKNYEDYRRKVNKALQEIGDQDGAWFPELTTYWARHTWATVAASLEIPKETIAQALGHAASSVTDIYIRFDLCKVDMANRRVLDWVLYGKK